MIIEPNITPGPAYQHYLALVFKSTDNAPLPEDIRYWLRQWHGRHLHVDLVTIESVLNNTISPETLQTVVDRLNNKHYSHIYITSDSNYERRNIRRIFREQFGISVPIQRYSKFVHTVRSRQMWKYYDGCNL